MQDIIGAGCRAWNGASIDAADQLHEPAHSPAWNAGATAGIARSGFVVT
jgi:hypothetical protein